MSNKKLKEQCFITLVMVIIMGGVLFTTYEAPVENAGEELAQTEDVLADTRETPGSDKDAGISSIAEAESESDIDFASDTDLDTDSDADSDSASDMSQTEGEYGGLIRLHVIANSNSDFDQKLKLKVRNKIMTELEGLGQYESIEETRAAIESQLDDLTTAADKVIRENGCNYKASAELGVHWIPEKNYGNVHFPAGNYEALVITLGRGEGENWWCVLFPPLCLVTEQEADEAAASQAAGGQVQLKSWLFEILEK